MQAEWAALDCRIAAFDDEFATHAKTDDTAHRLASIPGIGVVNATALAAAVGNAATFARGRDLAAWLGLVPRQMTTGGRPSLSQRAHKNTVIVALANKLARIVWAILRHGGTYSAHAVQVV